MHLVATAWEPLLLFIMLGTSQASSRAGQICQTLPDYNNTGQGRALTI
jgi:hypothetical protein